MIFRVSPPEEGGGVTTAVGFSSLSLSLSPPVPPPSSLLLSLFTGLAGDAFPAWSLHLENFLSKSPAAHSSRKTLLKSSAFECSKSSPSDCARRALNWYLISSLTCVGSV